MSELLHFIVDHEEAFKSRARLTSLYSDFSLLKNTNPDGYHANTSAWRSALEKACRAGLTPSPSGLPNAAETTASRGHSSSSDLVFRSGEDLVKQLENRDLGQPLALGDVINDAVASGRMLPLQPFLESETPLLSKRRTSWLPQITIPTPYEVAKWLLSQTGLFANSSTKLQSADYVVLRNIEEASSSILERVAANSSTPSSLIFSLPTFTSTFRDALPDAPSLSQLDIMVLLTYLSRDKHSISLSRSIHVQSETSQADESPLVIKFAPASSTAPPAPVTQQDITIASLAMLSHTLSHQLSGLERRASDLDASLRRAISKSSTSTFEKTRALSLLRQKKTVESTVQHRLDLQTQAEQTLTAIEDAVSNVEITKAMEVSTGVLRNLRNQVGGAEDVAKVMDGLADARADSEEIGRVLQQDAQVELDEEDVEEALEGLLRENAPKNEVDEKTGEEARRNEETEQKEGQAASKEGLTLPEVPTAEPAVGANDEQRPISARAQVEGEVKDRLRALSLDESRDATVTDPVATQADRSQADEKESAQAT